MESARPHGSLRRSFIVGLVGVVVVAFVIDVSQPPAAQWSAQLLLGAIGLYQAVVSPRLAGLGARCRFIPTCSHYGAAAIRRYGTVGGGARAMWRILRCGPWTPPGTGDPLL